MAKTRERRSSIIAGIEKFKGKSRAKKAGTVLALLAILLAAYSIVNFQFDIRRVETTGSFINDDKIISVLGEISSAISKDQMQQQQQQHKEVIVTVSSDGPYVTYFAGLKTVAPYGVSSEESLVDFMLSEKSTYLIAIENKSDEVKLKQLFSSLGLTSLTSGGDFQSMASYRSDHYTFHLYKLANSQSIQFTSPLAGQTIKGPSTGVVVSIQGWTLSPASFGQVSSTSQGAIAKITKVEAIVDNEFPYHLANPGPNGPNDWSTWSYQAKFTSEGTHQITVRSTDSTGAQQWIAQSIKVAFSHNEADIQ